MNKLLILLLIAVVIVAGIFGVAMFGGVQSGERNQKGVGANIELFPQPSADVKAIERVLKDERKALEKARKENEKLRKENEKLRK